MMVVSSLMKLESPLNVAGDDVPASLNVAGDDVPASLNVAGDNVPGDKLYVSSLFNYRARRITGCVGKAGIPVGWLRQKKSP